MRRACATETTPTLPSRTSAMVRRRDFSLTGNPCGFVICEKTVIKIRRNQRTRRARATWHAQRLLAIDRPVPPPPPLRRRTPRLARRSPGEVLRSRPPAPSLARPGARGMSATVEKLEALVEASSRRHARVAAGIRALGSGNILNEPLAELLAGDGEMRTLAENRSEPVRAVRIPWRATRAPASPSSPSRARSPTTPRSIDATRFCPREASRIESRVGIDRERGDERLTPPPPPPPPFYPFPLHSRTAFTRTRSRFATASSTTSSFASASPRTA